MKALPLDGLLLLNAKKCTLNRTCKYLTYCKTVEQAMSVRKLTASLLTTLAMACVSNLAIAQDSKLADPFEFDPDFNWFQPVYDADLQDLTAKKRAPSGWFATYDRIHLYGTGPDTTEPGIDKNSNPESRQHEAQLQYNTLIVEYFEEKFRKLSNINSEALAHKPGMIRKTAPKAG